MAERDLYSDPYMDEGSESEHPKRVHSAFDTWHKSLGDKVSKEDEMRMLGIRDAVAKKDKQRAEEHLAQTKTQSSWLYEELMKHPEITAIMRELSIMGF